MKENIVSSVSSLLFENATSYGSRAALKIGGRLISYQELNERGLTVGAALSECGAAGETVAIVGQRKPSSYFGIVGILYAGCSYVPINPKYSKARILAILDDANVQFLVGDSEDLTLIEPILVEQGRKRVKAIIVPEGRAPSGSEWYDEIFLRSVIPLDRPRDVNRQSMAYLLYTSGSSGVPKGVQVQHNNLLAFLRSMSEIYDLAPGFRASQTFDFSFDPSVADMFFTWKMGGLLCVLPEEELFLPHEYIKREKITFWNSVPALAGFMSRMGHLRAGSFPQLRNSMFCGEQFPRYLAEEWQQAAPDSTVENLYGPTEATIYISRFVYTKNEWNKEFKNSIIPIGKPFPEHELSIIDDAGNRVVNNEIGEIVFKGPQITKGYFKDQAKTDSCFVTFPWDQTEDRWYMTGDLGFFNDDGNLECIGRRDNQIKLGGRRIEVGEIEAALNRYEQTREAVVVPQRDENEIVTGCVAFTTKKISKDEENTIRNDSSRYIERIFFPKKILTISEFPLTAGGKIDRNALSTMVQGMMVTAGGSNQ